MIAKTIHRCAKGLLPPKLGVFFQHPPRPLSATSISHIPALPTPVPSISIVTPSFKQGHFIARTIDSILNQNYPNLEYIVQDGLSPDNTVEVIKSYGDRINAWESVKDKGQSDALNIAFAKTHGDIMGYLNSDDLLMPGSLATVADFFSRNPTIDAVYGHRHIIDENDNEIGRWIMPPHDPKVLAYADFIPQETLFWRRSIWEKAGGMIDAKFRFAMDWDLILRIQAAGGKFERLPFLLGAFRIHSAGKTTSLINEVGNKEMDFLRERTLGYLPDHVEIRREMRPYMMKATVLHHLHHLHHRHRH